MVLKGGQRVGRAQSWGTGSHPPLGHSLPAQSTAILSFGKTQTNGGVGGRGAIDASHCGAQSMVWEAGGAHPAWLCSSDVLPPAHLMVFWLWEGS